MNNNFNEQAVFMYGQQQQHQTAHRGSQVSDIANSPPLGDMTVVNQTNSPILYSQQHPSPMFGGAPAEHHHWAAAHQSHVPYFANPAFGPPSQETLSQINSSWEYEMVKKKKNNDAVKRCRQKKKQQEAERMQMLIKYEAENEELKKKLNYLEKDLSILFTLLEESNLKEKYTEKLKAMRPKEDEEAASSSERDIEQEAPQL
eukprot:Nk52_evm48s248 gene=Nk52_evmTU48s248